MASAFGRKSLLSLNNWNNNNGSSVSKERSNSNTSSRTTALAATASSMVDFWSRVSQQMAYIDGSTRSSSLLDGSTRGSEQSTAPPGAHVLVNPLAVPASCKKQHAASASCTSCTCSYSSAATASPPPSPPPTQLKVPPQVRSVSSNLPPLQRPDDAAAAASYRYCAAAPPRPKGSIYENYFHYADEDDEGVELEVLQPIAYKVTDAGVIPSSATFASVVIETASIGGGRTTTKLHKYQHQYGLCGRDRRCSGQLCDQYSMVARKASSWEESESVQRRRSVMLASLTAVEHQRHGAASCPGGVTASTVAPGILVIPTSSELQLLDKHDLRYYFQHPYPRLFVTYFVIFCNFLLFAEDPISHSHTESDIPMVGNVFSFVLTKYPPEWRWSLIKVLMWLLAILCGMVLGKLLIHGYLCGTLLRLKMFRDDQGSWMTMFLTVIVSLYVFSHAYNLLLMLWYDNCLYHINSHMGVTNASVMKAAACGTWLGDLITALMVTDMMLQDNLYPHWASWFRQLWRRSNVPRILIFWVGSVVATSVVVTLIVSDWISWDHLNRDFLATTELSRAFLASFILVFDLLIVMQDWDFPHFTTTLHVNLPGFSVATLQWKYAEVDVTGKWFNYGIIFLVMLLDLNMWKNQIFYDPRDFGQYTGPDDKVRTLDYEELLTKPNASMWTWESRSQIDSRTGFPYYEEDMQMNSRYMNYPLSIKWTAFIPSGISLMLFVALVSLYGRFPSNQTHVVDRNNSPFRVAKKKREASS